MRHFSAAIVGRDRPGIVAGVTRVLLEHGANLEDSQMTILRGHFTMMLVLAAPDLADAERLGADLERIREELDLESVSLHEVGAADPARPSPSHLVSVYGVDHPGIVHGVAAALARWDVNITDLQARVAGEGADTTIYSMVIEVALPEGLAIERLEDALAEVARAQDVELSVRPLQPDVL